MLVSLLVGMVSNVEIKIIDSELLLSVWTDYLWPNRESKIELTSAIKYGYHPYEYDVGYMSEEAFCFGAYEGDILLGVNSGHKTDRTFRSRGLFVFPEYRRKGAANALLVATCNKAKEFNSDFIWTMPREESLSAYQKAGFKQTSIWFKTETSDSNCFAVVQFRI